MGDAFKITNKLAIKNNICSNCHKLLNVAPIICTENGDLTETICGRCADLMDKRMKRKTVRKERQYIYESVAKCIAYPCANKTLGCSEVLRWENVKAHEDICPFVATYCPLHYVPSLTGKTCSWKGSIKRLDEHIKDHHKEHVLPSTQLNWSDFKSDMIIFIPIQDKIITALMKYVNKKERYCLLMLNGTDLDSKSYRYNLEFFNDDKSKSIILSKNRLQRLCKLENNINKTNRMLEIEAKVIKDVLKGVKNIKYTFKIIRKSKEEIAHIKDGKQNKLLSSSDDNNPDTILQFDKIKRTLKCESCCQYMSSPIYVTNLGWSICSTCNEKNTSPSKSNGLRNLALEELTKIQYPCRNKNIGCLFEATPAKILDHEDFCDFSDVCCILGSSRCNWKGLKQNMYNHLKDVHENNFMQVDINYKCDIQDNRDSYQVIYCSGEYFRYSMMMDELHKSCKINVQHLGTTEGNPKFRYQINIIDTSKMGLNVSLTNICQPITSNRAKAHETAVPIPLEIINNCIFDSKYYSYNISINKIVT